MMAKMDKPELMDKLVKTGLPHRPAVAALIARLVLLDQPAMLVLKVLLARPDHLEYLHLHHNHQLLVHQAHLDLQDRADNLDKQEHQDQRVHSPMLLACPAHQAQLGLLAQRADLANQDLREHRLEDHLVLLETQALLDKPVIQANLEALEQLVKTEAKAVATIVRRHAQRQAIKYYTESYG